MKETTAQAASSSSTPHRRSARRSSGLGAALAVAEALEEEEMAVAVVEKSKGGGRRRRRRKEKELNLVTEVADGVEVESPPKCPKVEGQGSSWKRMHSQIDAGLESGPKTPLPDKNLLTLILDKIQKKDKYGVFSNPVNLEELPDYHNVIESPMDFKTVRDKLTSDAYANLDQFEEDVFLICSNAMRYNAPSTIYFRQARSMQELARKNFENLRSPGEDKEPEVKKRGRRPGITSNKKQLGYFPVDLAGSDSTLAPVADSKPNFALDFLTKGVDKPGNNNVSEENHNAEALRWGIDEKPYRDNDFSGVTVKGMSKFSKKPSIIDEDKRNTYSLSLRSLLEREPSIVAAFQDKRKQLIPVGVHIEHTYVRSLARFAANLGPEAWRITSKKIESALPWE